MAVGQIVLIPSNQHQQVRVPSGNYLWPTIRILNPNDGIAYVKQNADCTGTGYGVWDYKVPSQSFALLPGGGEGWQSVGIFYIDQSGTNRPGELSIYLTQQATDEPFFVAIGRSLVTQSTTVDIVEGSQPANPGSGIGRLWIDTTDHLHILNSAGSDKIVLDNVNAPTYVNPLIQAATLAGDVGGTIGANIINTGVVTSAKIADGTIQAVDIANGVISGVKVTSPFDIRPASFYAQDIYADRGNGTAVYYFNDGSHYLYRSGPSAFILQGGDFSVSNNLSINGNTCYFAGIGSAAYLQWNGTNFILQIGSNGALLSTGDIYSGASGGGTTGGSVWATNYRLGPSGGSYYIALNATNNMYAVGMNILSGGWVGFSANAGINIAWNGGQLQPTHPFMMVSSNPVYFSSGNNYVQAGGADILRFGCRANDNIPGYFQFYDTYAGYYFNLHYNISDGYWHHTGYNQFTAAQWVIEGSAYAYLNLATVSNELGINVHGRTSGDMYVSGTMSAANVINRSSRKIKKNIRRLDDTESMTRLLDIRIGPVSFEFSDEERQRVDETGIPETGHKPNDIQVGFIAEDMQLVIPEVCAYDPISGEANGINYSALTSILWGAVRDLESRVKVLEK